MPDYIAPGVYVEETSPAGKTITGVPTTVTAFVGPTRYGPVTPAPELLTSVSDFERVYGGAADLGFSPSLNYLAHGVRAFFAEGGQQLYVARVAGKSKTATSASLLAGKTSRFLARFPGAAGNGQISVQFFAQPASLLQASAVVDGSFLRIKSSPPVPLVKQKGKWRTADAQVYALTAADETTGLELITLRVTTLDADGHSAIYADLGLDSKHPRYLGTVLKKNPAARSDQLSQAFSFDVVRSVSAFELFVALSPDANGNARAISLTGGTDVAPALADYQKAFTQLANLPDISIVAAPGHTAFPEKVASGVAAQLVAHAEQTRYRLAVLDPPAAQDVAAVQTYRSRFDSSFAAMYYPWIVSANPAFNPAAPGSAAKFTLPPSAFVCGIFVRSDLIRGVYKAPANEPARSALRLERSLIDADQAVLNPVGINCFRSFPAKGILLWGARTISSDLEWRYVPVRRYFIYLERSIDQGTKWAVFEPNAEPLWTRVRVAVENFLINEWKSGALMGIKPADAFVVRCDRTTMTQDAIDHGRLICLVGVATLKPAEFVIFRITQQSLPAPTP